MALPPKGQIGIFVGSWYSNPISQFIRKEIDSAHLDSQLLHVNNIERELVDDGMLIIKCWVHMSKDRQKEKLKSYQKDPDKKWRVTKKDIKHLELYDKFASIAERVIRETSTGPRVMPEHKLIWEACITPVKALIKITMKQLTGIVWQQIVAMRQRNTISAQCTAQVKA